MPLILPTPDEYRHQLSHYQRAAAVRRLWAASGDLDDLTIDVAARIYARLDRDCPEVIASRREVLETQYGIPDSLSRRRR